MKKHLYISHVGPITGEVNIDLKRFNVFIGPQSSGKSTIAKLISTFSWMEKEACTTLSEDILPGNKDFVSYVEDYHRIHGYFGNDSIVRYESDYVSINYTKGNFSLKLKEDTIKYHRIKVSYVPSDRNIITLRDIDKRELGETNFRSFLFDWLEARRYYDSTHKIDLLNLDVKYYYDSKRIDNQDRITHHNGQTYEIALYDASSGLQSAVPLVVLITYLKNLYYENYGKEISFESRNKRNDLVLRLVETILKPHVQTDSNESLIELYRRIEKENQEGNASYGVYLDKMYMAYYRLNHPHSISYIIEEPEQNLFPKTQCDLIQYIISACNVKSHQSSAVITTHSPYVLAMINNQLLAGMIKEKGVDPMEINKIIPIDSLVQSNEISVYNVGDGGCKSILDPKTGMIAQNYLDTASENNAALFDKLYKLYIKAFR